MRVESSGKASVLTEKDVLTEKSPPPTPTHTQQEDAGRRKQFMAQEGPDQQQTMPDFQPSEGREMILLFI